MARYSYLLSMEEDFFMKDHPTNPKVIEVQELCERITSMEERLELLQARLSEATKEMMTPRKRRIRRAK